MTEPDRCVHRDLELYARWSPMRQLGFCAGSGANPKLTHGAEMQTRHLVEALGGKYHAYFAILQ
jgi:hypothetical protein